MDRVLPRLSDDETILLGAVLGDPPDSMRALEPEARRARVRELFSAAAGTGLGNAARFLTGDTLSYEAALDALLDRLSADLPRSAPLVDREREVTRRVFLAAWEALPPDRRAALDRALSACAEAHGQGDAFPEGQVREALGSGPLTPFAAYLVATAVIHLVSNGEGIDLPDGLDRDVVRALALALGPCGLLGAALAVENEPEWSRVAPAVALIAAFRAKYELALDPETIRARARNPFVALLEREMRRESATGEAPSASSPGAPVPPPAARQPLPAYRVTVVACAVATALGLWLQLFEPFGPGWWNRFVALTAVSGTIGFLTNWIAIKMLFHPRRPLLRVGRRGFVQGLFPKNKALVARQVAAVVAGRLVNAAAIKAVLAERDVAGQARRWAQERLAALSRDERFRRDLSDWLYVKVVDLTPVVARKAHEVIDEYIDSRGALARGALRLGKTLLDIDEEAIAQRLRTHLDDRANFEGLFADLSRALDRLPDHLAADPRVADFERWMLDLIDALLHRLPVAEVVREQVMKQDEAEFERMVDAAGGRELAWIQILGGILGAIAGAGLFFVMS